MTRWLDYIKDFGWNIWDLYQAKCSLYWWIKRCGGLMWSCRPRNSYEKVGKKCVRLAMAYGSET